jgi:hypothetical protein
MAALDKRLKARKAVVELLGHRYTLRRPTARQRIEAAGGTRLDLARACVVGWDLTGLDMLPGGDASPMPFDRDLWDDWLDDAPDLWLPLIDAVEDLIARHDAALEAAAKN